MLCFYLSCSHLIYTLSDLLIGEIFSSFILSFHDTLTKALCHTGNNLSFLFTDKDGIKMVRVVKFSLGLIRHWFYEKKNGCIFTLICFWWWSFNYLWHTCFDFTHVISLWPWSNNIIFLYDHYIIIFRLDMYFDMSYACEALWNHYDS